MKILHNNNDKLESVDVTLTMNEIVLLQRALSSSIRVAEEEKDLLQLHFSELKRQLELLEQYSKEGKKNIWIDEIVFEENIRRLD